jgi:hypothetical protein
VKVVLGRDIPVNEVLRAVGDQHLPHARHDSILAPLVRVVFLRPCVALGDIADLEHAVGWVRTQIRHN